MATKDELAVEVELLRQRLAAADAVGAVADELAAEVDRLTAENTELREQLAAPTRAGAPTRPAPTAPSFGLCEGVRTDLQQVEKTCDPFTGALVTRRDLA